MYLLVANFVWLQVPTRCYFWAKKLAAPVLPFFFTCSLTSISASSHLSTGPTMASSRELWARHVYWCCLLGRSARMTQNDAPTLCLLFNFLRLVIVNRAAVKQDDGPLGTLFPFCHVWHCRHVNSKKLWATMVWAKMATDEGRPSFSLFFIGLVNSSSQIWIVSLAFYQMHRHYKHVEWVCSEG